MSNCNLWEGVKKCHKKGEKKVYTFRLRGAITKKNGKIWEKFPKGGGVKKTDENSQFQFGNLKNLGGVVSIFQKCLNYKSGSDPILKRRIEN